MIQFKAKVLLPKTPNNSINTLDPHSPQAGPSIGSSDDSTFILTQHSSSSEESREESSISSEIYSSESFHILQNQQ